MVLQIFTAVFWSFYGVFTMTVTKTENYTEEVTMDVNVTVPLLVRNGLETLLTSKLEKKCFRSNECIVNFFPDVYHT